MTPERHANIPLPPFGGWQFGWDATGRFVERGDPTGLRETLAYTAEGWVKEIQLEGPALPVREIDYRDYDPLGSPHRIDYPGPLGDAGIRRILPTFDARDRVTGATYTSATPEEIEYDDAGNRTRHAQGPGLGDDRRYDLDAADQLFRTRAIVGGVETPTVRDAFLHDLAGRRRVHHEFDASGVLTRTTTYGYDGLGRLVSVGRTDGLGLTLEYDPLGNRIRRTDAAGVSSLYLGGLVELRGVSGGTVATAVRRLAGPGPGGAVGEVTHDGLLRSLFGDAAHNVVAAVEVSSGVEPPASQLQVQRFRAFGELMTTSGPALVERGFSGLVPEGASGLVHMGARHYDPRTGRFLQPDPIGIVTDQPYAYAANNPFLYFDPLGLSPARLSGGILPMSSPGPFHFASFAYGEYQMSGLSGLASTPSSYAAYVSDYFGSASHELADRSSAATGWGSRFLLSGASSFYGNLSRSSHYTSSLLDPINLAISGLTMGAGGLGGPVATKGTSGLSNLRTRGFRPPAGTRSIPEGVPEGWRIRPTRGEGGVRYYDPQNPGNAARVMPGNPNSPYPNSQAPYVRWQRNGQALDANGNVVPKNSPDAHIPLDDFRFDPSLFK